MKLHPTLAAILEFPADPLSCAELAGCLGMHEHTLQRAVNLNKIEATAVNIRGSGKKRSSRISKSSAIRFLYDHTSHDRAMLRAAIEAECPALLPFLTGDAPRDAAAEAEALRSKRRKPARGPNIIPFDPQHDLFPQLPPATQVA